MGGFVTQIANPAYDTPIPASHLPTLFELCHFSTEERAEFIEAYGRAHPGTPADEAGVPRTRSLIVRLPDFGDADLNQRIDRLLTKFAGELGRTFAPRRRKLKARRDEEAT